MLKLKNDKAHKNRIRNGCIFEKFEVALIEGKMKESGLSWLCATNSSECTSME